MVEETETGASAPISEPQARDQAQAKRLVQLLSLIVTLQEAAGQDDDQADIPGRDEELKHWFPLVFYTILVIVLTLLGRYLCALVITLFVGEPLSNVPEENEASEDEKVEASSSRDEVLERPCHLLEPLSGAPLRAPPEPKVRSVLQVPSGLQAPSGQQESEVAQLPLHIDQPVVGPKIGGAGTEVSVPKVGTPEPKRIQVGAIPKTSMQSSSSSSANIVPVPKSGPTVRTTRYGTVYHDTDQCRFLRARMTGASRVAHLCSHCRALLESEGRDMPVMGDVLRMRAIAQTYHVPDGCNEAGRQENFQCCTVGNSRL